MRGRFYVSAFFSTGYFFHEFSKEAVHQAASKFSISGTYTDFQQLPARKLEILWIKGTLSSVRVLFQDAWQKSSLYYRKNLQGQLYLPQVWKRNDWFSTESTRVGKYKSEVQCYFLMSQVSSNLLHVLKVFSAQWINNVKKKNIQF